MAFVYGPRQMGKTTFAKSLGRGLGYLNWDVDADRTRTTSATSGGAFSSGGESPRWSKIRRMERPGQAEVWVDGKFVAEARDLDGYPSYLWLAEGAHKVTVYKGGYLRFEGEIDVRRGVHRALKVRLEMGESAPPGARPDHEEKDKKAKGANFSF